MNKHPNFNFSEYLKKKDVSFRIHDSADHKEYAICCVKCVENGEPTLDTNYKCWINLEKGTFNCYRCGWTGPLVALIQKLSNVNRIAAVRILQGRRIGATELCDFNLIVEEYDFDDEPEKLKEIELPQGFIGFDETDVRTPFHDYLLKRGITQNYAKENGWGFSRVGYVANRIIVPMYVNDKLVYWQARDILEEKHLHWGTKQYKKSLNPTGVSGRHVLYNYDVAKAYKEVYIVEGFIDAYKVGRRAVAIQGKRLHTAQVELLTNSKIETVNVLFDPDAYHDHKGIKSKRKKTTVYKSSAEEAANLLQGFFKVRLIELPGSRDAGSYSRRALREILR